MRQCEKGKQGHDCGAAEVLLLPTASRSHGERDCGGTWRRSKQVPVLPAPVPVLVPLPLVALESVNILILLFLFCFFAFQPSHFKPYNLLISNFSGGVHFDHVVAFGVFL